MHAASILFSRLVVIFTLAMGSYAVMSGLRCQARQSPCHVRAAQAVEVDAAIFGIDTWVDGEGYVFQETDHLHLVPGTSFGWQLKLQNPVAGVLLREEFTLPEAPAYWGIGSETELSDDRRTAVTTRRVTAADGSELQRLWTVTPGDPEGTYRLRIFVDDKLVQTFEIDAHEDHQHEADFARDQDVHGSDDASDDDANP